MLKVDDEKTLTHSTLICVDDNESLRRYRKMRKTGDKQDDLTVVNIEREDREQRESKLYVEVNVVDHYKNEVQKNDKVCCLYYTGYLT